MLIFNAATRAYKQAMHTLSALSSHPSPYQALSSSTQQSSNSILSSILPNLQGPIGTALRIADRLQQRLFYGLLGGGGKSSSARRKEEEMHHKSIKVLDLLQHSAELGNTDALYKLGHISLVRSSSSVQNILTQRLLYSFLLHHTSHLTPNSHLNPSLPSPH